MKIREITPEDIEIITQMRMQMLDEVTDDPLPEGLEEQIRRFVWNHLMDGSCIGMVAEVHDHVVADAVLYIFDTMPDEVNIRGVTAMLYNVYTLPEYRGSGIMAVLLEKLIRLAEDAGVSEIQMTAEHRAIPLYERMGFQVTDNSMKMQLKK